MWQVAELQAELEQELEELQAANKAMARHATGRRGGRKQRRREADALDDIIPA